MQTISPVFTACKLMGGQSALARLLKVSPVSVNEWKAGKRPVPAKRCVQIEQLTAGAVKRQDLRPLDYLEHWPELAEPLASRAPAATETVASGQGVVNV